MAEVKRFIAGAVCPRCAEMDRLVTYTNEEGVFKECVNCDFTEKQLVQVELSEMTTRVNESSSRSDIELPVKSVLATDMNDVVQVVKLVDLPTKNNSTESGTD